MEKRADQNQMRGGEQMIWRTNGCLFT